jgi:glycerophosphoryl diester phosphodiesterase
MIYIAHRGYSDKCGDNNIPSFLEAVYYGFDMVEMDIQLCKTGEIVVYHDTYLQEKPICEYTFKELQENEIVCLTTVFDIIKIETIKFFLDIKGNADVIYPLINILRSRFSSRQLQRIYISGFNRHFVEPLLESKIPVKIGLSIGNSFEKDDLEYLSRNMNFVCMDWQSLNHENIEMLHNKGILVYTFTCSDDYIWKHMKQFKIDGIVSNYVL